MIRRHGIRLLRNFKTDDYSKQIRSAPVITRLVVASLVLCCAPLVGMAEQRALLVGVGKYVTPNIDLPGIDLDLERMRETLKLMGFQDGQIHTLMDEQATAANVTDELKTWLKEGVQPNDRVVFYFSGHGSNVPDGTKDEDDGVDEVLVMHDMKLTRTNGRARMTGMIDDDRLSAMIAAIPSKNIWMIVDACHSGTVSRSLTLKNRSLGAEPVFVKSFNYTGMPEPKTTLTRSIQQGAPSVNFVSLSAANDGEKAIGTSKGGIFTIGMTEAIKRLSAEGKTITVKGLRDETAEYIRKKVDKEQMHNPQVNGNASLAEGTLNIVPVNVSNGPNRKKLMDMVTAQGKRLDLAASSARYAIDEPVKLTLNLPTEGYLNIVSVDAKDNATVLYPNRYDETNAVKAGKFSMPTAEMNFELLAAEPFGPTLVVAFLSTDPINFYKETLDERDENGNINADFSSLSHTATRAIRIAPKKKEMYAAQLEVEVVKAR